MATERDNAFSTGTGGMDQSTDFGSQGLGAGATDRAAGMGSDQSEPVVARARGAVAGAGHKAAERVQERIADQMNRATGQLESVASSLRSASEQMPEESMGRYMLQAATQVDNLATFLNNREVTEIFDEVEDFARRQPAVFIGGAFALGVLGARFLRSSRQQLEGDSRRSWQSDGYSDMSNGESLRSEFGRTSRDYPQAGVGYGTEYLSGRGGENSGLSSGSFQAAGSGEGASRSLDNTRPTRDYASDRPDSVDGLGTGERLEGSGSGGLGETGALRNTERLGASSLDSGSAGLSDRTSLTDDRDERSPSASEDRDPTRSPDYL